MPTEPDPRDPRQKQLSAIDAAKYAIRFFFISVGVLLFILLVWTAVSGPDAVAAALFSAP